MKICDNDYLKELTFNQDELRNRIIESIKK